MFLKKSVFFLFFFSLCLIAIDGIADEGDLNFMNISTKEGLSSNTVNAMLKDSHGFMWFATGDGLNKFDGKHFTIYRHSATEENTITSNEILDLYEDQLGALWVATSAGLVSYNRKLDSFIDYTPNQNLSVASISSDASGMIWLASYSGLVIVNPVTKQQINLNLKTPSDKALITKPVVRVFRDKKNRMWLCTGNGLYQYNKKQNTFVRFSHLQNDANSLVDNTVSAIFEDNKGNLWVGTENGLSMLRSDGKGFVNYTSDVSDKNTLSSNIVYAIAGEQNGKIWIGTEEGLNILDPATKKIVRIERNGRNNYSFRGKAVKSILIDKQGIYWVAAFRSGVNKYDKNLAFFNLVQSNRYDPFGLDAPMVTSFVQADDKSVFVGTDGGGLSLFDIKPGLFRHIPLAKTGDDRLSILAMEKVGTQVWVGTYLKGLFIYDTKTGTSKHIRKGGGKYNLSGENIFCIKKDTRGNVWIGNNGEGVDCYDLTANTFSHFNKNEKGKNRIEINGFIRAIEEDNEGNIWIGTSGSGVAVYDPVTGHSKILSKANRQLPNDNVATVYCTAEGGEVYIGTVGGGLTVYDKKKNTFSTYSEQAGLANGVVYKILEDNLGKIWVSTNSGISSFDPQSRKFKNYFYHNGIQQSPFVSGSGIKLADGRLFFGGTDGFNYFNPAQLYTNKNIPVVVLTDLKVSNQSVKPSEDAQITEDIAVAKEINLDYKQNFSLSFAALNYTSPQENRYFYKLENFDKEWNSVGSSNTAVYTNLDPGEYTFKVRATSDGGEWSTKETSVKIYVKPPFWLTYYAYAFYLFVLASILWTIRYLGIQKLKAKFAVEQERTKVQQFIEQERREAERQHEFDQLKINFLTNISHEFRTPISLIMGPVEQLLQQETGSEKSAQLNMVRRNARRLLNLVNQLLDFRNIKQKEQKLNASEGDFISFSKDVAESFKDLAERKHINFVFTSSLRFYFTFFDHDKIERILFNLLSNAFKFTLKDGEVMLRIDETENNKGLKITLSDTGIGMDEVAKAKIFDRFFQSDTKGEILNQGSGIGLSITKEFVRLHGGTIEVESIAGKGSVFTIYFPFRKMEDSLILEEDAVISDSSFSVHDHDTPEETVEHDSNLPVILLVEDNEDFRFYLKDNLKQYYKIVEASNGKDGWQKVLASHPELVVSDISMPHVTGIELCHKIKSDKRTNHIPVLLLTALTGEEDQLIGLEKGANDYMTKPFNFEILNAKIRNLLTLNESLKTTYSKRIKLDAPEIEIESANEKLLNKVIQYIEANLTNPQLSVEDLSRHVGMSRGSLYTKVLELTGESPVEFIRSIKLDKAAVLLEKSEMNVSQISYSVGFATPNYFARAFKVKFNMLPSEYITAKRVEKTVEKSAEK